MRKDSFDERSKFRTQQDMTDAFNDEEGDIGLSQPGDEIEEHLTIPDIGNLAKKSETEVAQILANVLKSRACPTELVWRRDENKLTIKHILVRR